jgi:hypothetical protein
MLRCTVPRLEAALGGIPPSLPCPEIDRCPLARIGCRIFYPGWYCADRDLIVLPTMLLDDDHESGADDEDDDEGI